MRLLKKIIFYKTLNIQPGFKTRYCKYVPIKDISAFDLLYEIILNINPDKVPVGIIDEIRRNTPNSISMSPVDQISNYLIYMSSINEKILTMKEICLLGTFLEAKYVENVSDIFYCWKSPLNLKEYLN